MTLSETALRLLGKQHKRTVMEVAITAKAVMTGMIAVMTVAIAVIPAIAAKPVTTGAIAVIAATAVIAAIGVKAAMTGVKGVIAVLVVEMFILALTWMSILSPKVTLSMLLI
jgi:hypothetical protein